MIGVLIDILKADCNNFDLQYKKDKYRLVLDGAKDFTGDTVEDVLIEAIDWLDSNDTKPSPKIDYKAFGYESDGTE